MDKQQIFDEVAYGIIQQGAPSVNASGSCRYRGPNGRKCAAGHLIPDDRYKDSMEGCRVHAVPYLGGQFAGPLLDFIAELQNAHDANSAHGEHFIHNWSLDMMQIAVKHELDSYCLRR